MTMFTTTNQTLVFLRVVLGGRMDRARRSERGASAVEWVLISALLIGIAIAVGAIIMNKLKGKADGLDLG
jgi:Flp pilus assembly pilin Flp